LVSGEYSGGEGVIVTIVRLWGWVAFLLACGIAIFEAYTKNWWGVGAICVMGAYILMNLVKGR
jgi:hypothetical protein